MGLLTQLIVAALFALRAFCAVTSTGVTLSIGSIYYYAPPYIVASIAVPQTLSIAPGSFAAVTVITTADNGFATAELAAVKANYSSADDVWSDSFSDAYYIQYSGAGMASNFTALGGAVTITASSNSTIPNGPYFLAADGSMYQAHRLYADVTGSFTETLTTSPDGKISVLPAGIPGQSLAVAVPSRLYFTPTADKPLLGVRLGVKDIYALAGTRRSNGNRAWYWLYPEATLNGPVVQRLIDAGCVVVGKTKTSQFANGETATADWVDYHSPFNPRGDGYQDPSSSSSGSGAAAGAYPWLDLTLGSDTGGSVRNPAQVQGVYGNRPSHGLVSLDQVMPLAPELDTPGLLTRDPFLWKTAASVVYSGNITFSTSYPSKILISDFPATNTTDGDMALYGFVAKLSAFLNATVTKFNVSESWAANTPSNGTSPIEQFLNLTYPILISKEQIKNVRDPFYKDYAAQHGGRRPFVDPVPLARWAYVESVPNTIEEAVANKTTFQNWIAANVLVPDVQTCSNSLLLYVGTPADPSGLTYRNAYRKSPVPPFGFGTSSISIFSETPDMVVPVGKWSYNSTITNHTEYMPVAVDIMAAKGCDGMIFSLVTDLYAAGILDDSVAGGDNVDEEPILFRRCLTC